MTYTQASPAPYYKEETLALLGVNWWYDYLAEAPLVVNFSAQEDRKLFGHWRLTAAKTAASISTEAAAAKAAYGSGGPVYWYLSNEPNNAAQSNTAAVDFAPLYKKYRDAILAGDPDAKIVGPALVWWDEGHIYSDFPGVTAWLHSVGHSYGKEWYEAFRAEYFSLYGLYPPMDVFNIHLYDFHLLGASRTGVEVTAIMDEYHDVEADLLTWPETAGLPIWVTELGIPNFNNVTLTDNQRVDFLHQVLDTLSGQTEVERIFWFLVHRDFAGLEWGETSELLASPDVLNVLGAQFRGLAKGHYAVSTTADTPDANPGDGICNDGTGHCSLRAAIEEANTSAGMDTIGFYFPTGHTSHSDPDGTAGTGDEYYHLLLGGTPLPALQQPLFINGLLQPDASCGGNTITTTLPGGEGRKIAGVNILLDFGGLAAGTPVFSATNSNAELWLQGVQLLNSPTRQLLTGGKTRIGCSFFWTTN
ncbi:glycosyl hydrolase [Lewinella sp.]|uniref:glycosyl hydrolase n=1 Tax=Lewinella sp. TaxID=2004506 RepID=UPI003D6B1FA9